MENLPGCATVMLWHHVCPCPTSPSWDFVSEQSWPAGNCLLQLGAEDNEDLPAKTVAKLEPVNLGGYQARGIRLWDVG